MVPARASTSPLERTVKACKSTDCMKNMLGRGIARWSGRPVCKTPRSSVRYPARADIQLCIKCWEHDLSARAALPPLERKSKFWKFQIEFLSFTSTFNPQFMHVMAQNSHILMLTCYQYKITTLGSSISYVIYMHTSH